MSERTYFEDVEVGIEMPSLKKHPTTEQLVRYAGASGDFYPIHYDKDFAIANGLSGVILHGALKNAFLGQVVTDWMGELGTLKELTCQYRAMDYPGDTLTCKGKVIEKYKRDGECYVKCQLWIENSKGERTTHGTALVTLPSRKAARNDTPARGSTESALSSSKGSPQIPKKSGLTLSQACPERSRRIEGNERALRSYGSRASP